LAQLDIDVAVPQMFCLPGMTSYRALFDVLDIPMIGNPADVMALTANKSAAKAIVAAAGVLVADGEVLRSGDRPTMSPPVVVKPVDGDISSGVTLLRHPVDYDDALDAAFAHSSRVLVEDYIELGREVRCGIIVRGGELVCLPLEEYDVDRDSKPIRTRGDKISRGADGELSLVAKVNTKAWIVDTADPITERVWAAARRCHLALGCRDYSLFDFRIDPDGTPWFLEAGLYCSFARQSVIAVMAAAAGIPLTDLFADAVTEATARRVRRGWPRGDGSRGR
jgi:D-alanine-D-alanine ligase